MDAFIGEIRLLPYTYTPVGWLLCDGRQCAISSYQALYAVIMNTFGGDLKTYFNLPDLRGLVVPGAGDDPTDTFDPAFASKGGSPTAQVTTTTLPSHTHTFVGATSAQTARVSTPAGNLLTGVAYSANGTSGFDNAKAFSTPVVPPTTVQMNPATLSTFNGLGQPHENRQPYLAMGFYINFDGLYPARN